jgi:hypothetical protein
VWLNGSLRYRLFGEVESDQVLFGRRGRLFLTSHPGHSPFSLIDAVCGVGIDAAEIRDSARVMAKLLEDARQLVPRSMFIAVPTAPVLYPEDLPPWLAARCGNASPALPAIRDALAAGWPALSGRMLYPIDTVREVKRSGAAIPRSDFHWSGIAAKAVVEAASEGPLGMAKRRDIAEHASVAPSDLSGFVPGLTLHSPGTIPDFESAGIRACYGASCLPELAPFASVLRDVGYFRWASGDGATLLLVSDSFGLHTAGYFAEYFSRVIHVNIEYERLSAEQQQRLRNVLFARFKPDAMVVLFHDAGVRSAAILVDTALLQP